MGRKKLEAVEEVVIPVEKVKEIIETKTISQTQARKLQQDPNDGRKKPKSEAQMKAWERCLERRNEFQASKREQKQREQEERKQREQEELEKGSLVKVKVAKPRAKPKAKPKPVPQQQFETASETESESESETELDTDIPSDVPVPKKRVMVPRAVKETVRKVKALDSAIKQVAQNSVGYRSIIDTKWK
jgi:hypothetical protein